MIVTIHVVVSDHRWEKPAHREIVVEVKNQPLYLCWEKICANLVEAALGEWESEEKQRMVEKEAQDAS